MALLKMGHTQVMVRLTDYHQNPQAASDAPRWRLDDQMNVELERDVPVAVIDKGKPTSHRYTGYTQTTVGRPPPNWTV